MLLLNMEALLKANQQQAFYNNCHHIVSSITFPHREVSFGPLQYLFTHCLNILLWGGADPERCNQKPLSRFHVPQSLRMKGQLVPESSRSPMERERSKLIKIFLRVVSMVLGGSLAAQSHHCMEGEGGAGKSFIRSPHSPCICKGLEKQRGIQQRRHSRLHPQTLSS